jgi:hypothetical protein
VYFKIAELQGYSSKKIYLNTCVNNFSGTQAFPILQSISIASSSFEAYTPVSRTTMKLSFVVLLFATAKAAHGQAIPTFPDAEVQTTGWNSSFKFSQEQIELGQLSPGLANSLEVILNFDRSQLANGGPGQDRFYHLGSSYKHPQGPGEVLKVEDVTDPTPL